MSELTVGAEAVLGLQAGVQEWKAYMHLPLLAAWLRRQDGVTKGFPGLQGDRVTTRGRMDLLQLTVGKERKQQPQFSL